MARFRCKLCGETFPSSWHALIHARALHRIDYKKVREVVEEVG